MKLPVITGRITMRARCDDRAGKPLGESRSGNATFEDRIHLCVY